MPNVHYDRLVKKYGDNVRGKKYQKLMQEVIRHNSKSISTKIAQINEDQWKTALKRVTPKGKTFILPDLRETVPIDQFFINKSVQNGKIINDTLKENLNKKLRKTLNSFTEKTGEQNFVVRRGRTAGQINAKLIDQFENELRKTFNTYTKRDPVYGVPKNIRDIAVTEMNSVVNNTKTMYMQKALEKNPDLIVTKSWIHYPGRSKEEPRRGHAYVGRLKPKKFDYMYNVPLYKKIGNRYIKVRVDQMPHPHSDGAELDQLINCHCNIIYYIRRK